MARANKPKSPGQDIAAYLRSIDVQLDARDASRISHYLPTEKGARLITAMLGEGADRTFIVVAPYGSGKSLAASYALHLIENRPGSNEALKSIEPYLLEVDSVLGAYAAKRRRRAAERGLAVPLSGPVSDLPGAIKAAVLDALGRFKLGREARPIRALQVARYEDVVPFLEMVQAKAQDIGFDRIALIWDEFGKHLEFLVQEGRTSELFHIQKLAEYVARTRVPMSLSLFLHMGLMHYAGGLSQSVLSEWRKIEGRFQILDYVDDSKQLYALVARLILLKRNTAAVEPHNLERWVEYCRKHLIFREFSDDELTTLLEASYPVTPPALYMLPRLTGRIAQNERTTFHFIENWDGVSDVRPADLYDYFEPQMKSDITTGGTHRQWLESHSALRKIDGDGKSEAVIKTAALFGLGMHGRSGGASLELLRRAWGGYEWAGESTPCPVKALIERKLLLYRPYKDEVSVWHGSDLDLRGHLEAEKARRAPAFDLLSFLSEQAPPPSWRPLAYNSEFCIRRFFSSAFATAEQFVRDVGPWEHSRNWEGDGHILFVIPQTQQERDRACQRARGMQRSDLIVAVSREPVALAESALEVHCLLMMQGDQDLVASDPLALDEIRSLTSDAEAHLNTLVRRCTIPDPLGPVWFHNGKEKLIDSAERLRDFLSEVCRSVFRDTPVLNNELINKRKPSAVIVNSRKKLVLGILERAGKPDLGLPDTTPDGSMLRSLLKNTGIYREGKDGAWAFADVNGRGIADAGLRRVWRLLAAFLSTPASRPKALNEFLQVLESPPIGVRPGVVPILLAAGIRAHGGMTAIRRNGQLVEDLLPTVIEEMASNPHLYTFEPIALDDNKQAAVQDFLSVFGSDMEDGSTANLLSSAGDILLDWREGLPRCAGSCSFGDAALESFRRAIFSATDSIRFFIDEFPAVLLAAGTKPRSRRRKLGQWREALETADRAYYEKIAGALRRYLDLAPNDTLVDAARGRAELFSDEFFAKLPDKRAAQFLRRLRMPYSDDRQLSRSIAQLLTGRRVSEFDDDVMDSFVRELRRIADDIERTASWVETSLFGEGLRSWVVANRKNRISELYRDLVRLEGATDASSFVSGLAGAKERRAT